MKKIIFVIVLLCLTFNQAETEQKTYLYAYPPTPQPAKTRVSVKIYWEMKIDFNINNVDICSIDGGKIPIIGKLILNRLSSWSGEIIWECSGAATGVYFIHISHGNNAKAVKVIIT